MQNQKCVQEKKFCHWAFPLPRVFAPFLCKLFDQCDLYKQSVVLFVFWANFSLNRWRILVYFSFIFNGWSFRHWTHELLSCPGLVLHCPRGRAPLGGKWLVGKVVLSLSMILWLQKLPCQALRALCVSSLPLMSHGEEQKHPNFTIY